MRPRLLALLLGGCCIPAGPHAAEDHVVQSPAATPITPIAHLTTDVCYRPTGARVTPEGTLRVWCHEPGTNGAIRTYSVPELAEVGTRVVPPVEVHGLELTTDGAVAAITSLRTDELVVMPLDGAPTVRARVRAPSYLIAIAPDGTLVATVTSGERPTVHVFRADTGAEVATIRDSVDVNALRFGPDGTLYVAGGTVGRIGRWRQGTRLEAIALAPHRGEVNAGLAAIALSPDGTELAVTTNLGEHQLASLADARVRATGEHDWDPTRDMDLGAVATAWPTADRLYVVASGRSFAVCDPATGVARATYRFDAEDHFGLPTPRVTTSSDGARLVITSERGVFVIEAPR